MLLKHKDIVILDGEKFVVSKYNTKDGKLNIYLNHCSCNGIIFNRYNINETEKRNLFLDANGYCSYGAWTVSHSYEDLVRFITAICKRVYETHGKILNEQFYLPKVSQLKFKKGDIVVFNDSSEVGYKYKSVYRVGKIDKNMLYCFMENGELKCEHETKFRTAFQSEKSIYNQIGIHVLSREDINYINDQHPSVIKARQQYYGAAPYECIPDIALMPFAELYEHNNIGEFKSKDESDFIMLDHKEKKQKQILQFIDINNPFN